MKKKLRIKERYSYVMHGDVISAGAKFAGNWVWGHARRHPADEYDETFGKDLAAARCNEKIAAKRYARAQKKYLEMCEELKDFQARAHKLGDYLRDSYEAHKEAKRIVAEVRSGIES